MSVNIISIMLIGLVVIVVMIDVVPIFNDWLGRIHIGRYTDKIIWNKLITNIGVKWINKTPRIKVTDNTRLILIDILKGNYIKSSIQQWQEASLILGLSEYIKYNNDLEAREEITKYLNNKFDRNGQWVDKPQHVDGAMLAYSVMKLDFIDIDFYKKAFDYIWEMIQDHIGKDGTAEYRKAMKGYRYVDTIGFICPFLIAYGIRYNNNECIELALRQILEFERFGMLDEHYIPCHAYRLDSLIPIGLYGWGRGVGWFAVGLIDSWNELPKHNKYKPVLEKIVTKLSKALLLFQQKNGSWNWIVTRDECTPDSSATAALGWFMLNAAKIDGFSKVCLNSAGNAVSYLMKVTRRKGQVDFSQGDTKDIGVHSMLFNILPFTQGFCIRVINCKNKGDDYDKKSADIINNQNKK